MSTFGEFLHLDLLSGLLPLHLFFSSRFTKIKMKMIMIIMMIMMIMTTMKLMSMMRMKAMRTPPHLCEWKKTVAEAKIRDNMITISLAARPHYRYNLDFKSTTIGIYWNI